MNVNKVLTKDYEKKTLGEHGKNEPKTNPKRTQSNPIQSQLKPKKCRCVFKFPEGGYGLLLVGRFGDGHIHIARFYFFDILKHDGTCCVGELRKTDGIKDKAVDVFAKNNRSKVLLRTVKIDVFEDDVPGVFGVEAPDRQGSDVDAGLSRWFFGLFSGAAAFVFYAGVTEDHTSAGCFAPAFDGDGCAVDAGGGQVGDNDIISGVAGSLEQDRDRRGDVLHSNIRNKDVFEGAVAGVPAAGLEYNAGKHIVSVGGAVRVQPRAVEETILDNHISNRAYNPNPVAGAVDNAVLDEKIVDVAACYRIVTGEELAVDDIDVTAGLVAPATEVDAVPATRDLDAADVDLFGEFYHDGVVCRVLYRDIADVHAAAVAEDNGVWAAHFLFAAWIEDLVTIDDTRPDNVYVFDTDTENQRAVPFAESRFGCVGWWSKVLVVIQFFRANQSGAGLEEERYVVPEVDGAGDVSARPEADLSPAGVGTGLDGLVNCSGVDLFTIARSAVVAHVEDTNNRQARAAKICQCGAGDYCDGNYPRLMTFFHNPDPLIRMGA